MNGKLQVPLISVIMPVYNGEKYLRQAIESILAQTFSDFEFLIIDDGSSDGSAEILREYQVRDPRIIVHTQKENAGIITALNNGINLARGEYIARMDADDISLPERLERQVEFLETHPEVSVLSGSIQVIDQQGNRISTRNLPRTKNLIIWSLCFFCPIVHPAVMVRREVLINIGGYRTVWSHAEDYDLWERLSGKTQFANLPQLILRLRKHKSNITVLHLDENIASSIQISQNLISGILHKDTSKENVQILWNSGNKRHGEIQQTATLIIELSEHFRNGPNLTWAERQYIKTDTSRRLVHLVSRNTPLSITWPILKRALFYDPIPVFKYLAKTIYEILRKMIA